MKVSGISRYALCASMSIAMLAGCGGSQPPIGAPGYISQTRAFARPASSAFVVFYRFQVGSRGYDPTTPLLEIGGTLYGTTERGAFGYGVVYRLSARGVQRVLHRFGGGSQDGQDPMAGLVSVNGTLYGTTRGGGVSGCGTVYSISRRGKETLLHSFLGAPNDDGCAPEAPLTYVDGMLYGTTEHGGGHGGRFGVVYRISTKGVETIVYRFGSRFGDARDPTTGLVDVNGTLYGTTRHGGTGRCRNHGCGTVYSISQSGKEKVLYSFGDSGDGPHGGLIAVNRTLYGTTSLGGPGGSGSCNKGCGTVYSITTHGKETVLYNFAGGSDGEHPVAGLIDVNGTLYGTTVWGGGSKYCGPKGCGTIYSVSTSGAEQVLHSFSGLDGDDPKAGLIDVNGTLYGTTSGGDGGGGTVFALTP